MSDQELKDKKVVQNNPYNYLIDDKDDKKP